MKNWQKLVVSTTTSIKGVIETLNRSAGAQIVLVTDQGGRLLGTISDGDLRRYMLRGQGLEGTAMDVMHKDYLSVPPDTARASVLVLMREHVIRQVPIVGEDKVLEGVFLHTELIEAKPKDNIVLIMAGGLGERLRPLTDRCPKPMLAVGGKPILETIIENLISEGFSRFVIAINYLGEQISNYFTDGGHWGVRIDYLQEKERLGTAGAASLMQQMINNKPVVVTNGDVLTRVKYTHLLDFHSQTDAALTVCLRDYQFEVPFGVVNLNKDRVTAIVEKPVINHHVNAGIYVMNPSIIHRMKPGDYLDMPDLITDLIANGIGVSGFPLHEYWMDVGRHDELKLANQQYNNIFE